MVRGLVGELVKYYTGSAGTYLWAGTVPLQFAIGVDWTIYHDRYQLVITAIGLGA